MDNTTGDRPHLGPEEESAFRAAPQQLRPALADRQDPGRKSPALAVFLSLIMPGLGQVYAGFYEQGFTHALIVASLIAVLDYGIGAGEPLLGFFLAFYWLFNVVDAHRKAVFHNQAAAGLRLPGEGGISSGRGSLVGGAAMIVIGAVLLAHTRFGYSLKWIEDWWPAALVLMGGYLAWRAVVEGRGRRAGARPQDRV
jgi:TM2 domain-containing membrane protein YozV